MIKQKRGMSAWIWILIALVLIGVGIGIYFLVTSGNGSSIFSGGNSIPQPPALPN
ncbi:MAG: hypothetical protein Q7S56_04240 [Nanoarchaeota archaeon]|nr:hypothetical protein [Nanoarchaeota archaeon]